MQDFRQLKVWEKGYALALAIYRDTAGFPREEIFGLRSQLRRAAVSIPSNIAEGCGRSGSRELAHFLGTALGSASEVLCQLLLARDLGYLAPEVQERLKAEVEEVKRMLAVLIQKVLAADNC